MKNSRLRPSLFSALALIAIAMLPASAIAEEKKPPKKEEKKAQKKEAKGDADPDYKPSTVNGTF